MKSLLALAFVFGLAATLGAEEAPPVTIHKVIELSDEALKVRGNPAGVYATSIVLDKSSLLAKEAIWKVTWSKSFPSSMPNSREVGLEVSMKGDVVHVVKGKAAK